ncbi:hypothetical protein FRC09_001583 [Ceratobasidium sp. 395]|nr:hypothetical protein FRC09_001583 [Ceratobasidium sp. 395]
MQPDADLLNALEKLKEAVEQLPKSTPEGVADGIVGQNFAHEQLKNVEGSLWELVDRAYTRCFSITPGSNQSPETNIQRGRFGMDLVIEFFDSLAHSSRLKSSDIFLVQLKLQQLTELVYTRIKSLPPDPPTRRDKGAGTKKNQCHGSGPGHSKRKPAKSIAVGVDDSENDGDYEPPSDDPGDDSGDDSDAWATTRADTAGTEPEPKFKRRERPDYKRKGSSGIKTNQRPAKKKRTWSTDHRIASESSDLDADSDDHMRTTNQTRKKSTKAKQWALEYFTEPIPERDTRDPKKRVWKFYCKYCSAFRCINRTKGCLKFVDETSKFQSSNFTSHIRDCKSIPPEQKQAATSEPPASDTRIRDVPTGLGALFATPDAITAPETKSLAYHKSRFRSRLIQTVIHDNYPLTFGEGLGMISLFNLVNPDIELPSHQTMRRDLDKLYGALSKRAYEVMKRQQSRVSISADAWSSKNSIYSLAGLVTSFIDDSWHIHHLPIDLIHLDAEHDGASMGKRVFKSARRRGIGSNLIASVTDNASNNSTMNAAIAKQYDDEFGLDLNVKNIASLSELHAMESLDDEAIFALAKSFDPEEPYEKNQDTADEEARMNQEFNPNYKGNLPPEEASEDSDGFSDFDTKPAAGNRASATTAGGSAQGPSGNNTTKKARVLNVLEKIHAIAVHATGSPARRKKMRQMVWTLCGSLLAIIKSMPVRWNSVLAEIRRAYTLKKAINQWVATLDEGLTSNALAAARERKQRWAISDNEWDLVALLIKLLEPFERASLSFSKKNADASLCAVLPTYAYLLDQLDHTAKRIAIECPHDPCGISSAINSGREKLIKYINIAQDNHLTLLAMMCHPQLRHTTFSNTEVWNRVSERGQTILEHVFETYCADYAEDDPPLTSESQHTASASQSASTGTWMNHLYQQTQQRTTQFKEELHDYLTDRYIFDPKVDEVLDWWRTNSKSLPIVGRVARDVLCIPAASVSVERLFSQCRYVMTDNRIMAVETARRIVMCQQWLKAGLGTNLPDFIGGVNE